MKKQSLELFLSEEWIEVVTALINNTSMKDKYKDHELKGNWKGFRECHLQPDLLLIYSTKNNEIELARIGSHAELFA